MAEHQQQLYAVMGYYEGFATDIISIHEDCEMANQWAQYSSWRHHKEASRIDDPDLIRKLGTDRFYGPQGEQDDAMLYYVTPVPRPTVGAPPPRYEHEDEDEDEDEE